jgi:adenylate kinase
LTTGDFFRNLDPESEPAKIMRSGKLLDDDIVNQIMTPAFDKETDVILDGYPRTVGQAEYTLKMAEEKGFEPVCVFLELSEAAATDRVCLRIGKAIVAGQAPRKDDLDMEALRKRYQDYYDKTVPMIDYLKEKLGDGKRFFTINANDTIANEYRQIEESLASLCHPAV